MIAHRRRKKRPNYGIRTVEVDRGVNGFGFTISGQQPCILSCIVTNSPADQAGLKAGDFLISVNGLSVSKVTHDAVVQLIGNSVGPIKMSIAEYYYSDSSDEDVSENYVTRKPRYPNRPRVNKKLETSLYTNFKNKLKPQWGVNHVEVQESCPSPPTVVSPPGYKVFIGYLGTIEMPNQLQPSSRMHTVSSCIRKFRQERRSPTSVVMMILPSCITLTNCHEHTLAVYPSNRIAYINSSEKDPSYFGLITTAINTTDENYATRYFNQSWRQSPPHAGEDIDISISCHVFVIDTRLAADHALHIPKSETFNIKCTRDVISGDCLEFPKSSEYIVNLVQKMYGLPRTPPPNLNESIMKQSPIIHKIGENLVANSPQPSASSNSDSGIGFRDDCGLVSDRILVVDFPAQLPLPTVHNQSIHPRPAAIDGSSIAINTLINSNQTKNTCEDDDHLHQDRHLERSKSIDNISDQYLFKTPKSIGQHHQQSRGGFTSTSSSARNYSHDDLNSIQSEPLILDHHYDDKVTNFGSLQDLSGLAGNSTQLQQNHQRSIQLSAVSEPDVRSRGGYLNDNDCQESICSESTEMLEDVNENKTGRVANWAVSFDKLLEDDKGREAFTEFLEKEFSAENIHFWVSCKNFQNIKSSTERVKEAQLIYNKHLCKGAVEPVNVDSQARNITQDALVLADTDLFVQAQKQIFNLMKFDCYPRFLKSDLYKKCLANDDNRQNKSESDVHNSAKCSSTSKLKKSLSNAEDRRRKSLLPWHRKNRSKSKDRGEMEYCHPNITTRNMSQMQSNDSLQSKPDSSEQNDMYNSRTSLTSWDVTDDSKSIGGNSSVNNYGINRNAFCRVILTDGATTVVQIRACETIREMINRLLDKRGLSYQNFEVFLKSKSSKPIDLNKSSADLAGCEVIVEHRIVFKLDLPNRKIISVKSKPTKILTDVLRPILHKYGYKLELVRVFESAKCERLMNVHVPVTVVDGFRLSIQMCNNNNNNSLASSTDMASSYQDSTEHLSKPNTTSIQSLNEITNKVFEDLRQGQCNRIPHMPSDHDSLKSDDDWGSEHSSNFAKSISSRLHRHNSANGKSKKSERNKGNHTTSTHSSADDLRSDFSIKKPLIAILKPGIKLQMTHHKTSESDELYEGLKRAQRFRLEDQRGTEINFELPDFLKDKENSNKKKLNYNESELLASKFYDTEHRMDNHDRTFYNVRNKTQQKSDSVATSSSSMDDSSPSKLSLPPSIPTTNDNLSHDTEPPPLPPKPKVLPIKPSNWKKLSPTKLVTQPQPQQQTEAKGNSTTFLEQSTSNSSSFV
ncbi:regulator of G-protein signaling loco [Chrysoperla carnea]|uniref:regulator of G-protein signaling loco n=1 Tax=Chrysoperla carnea TaxID=189513 RepID=UPI001D05E4BA|nr:regulator of G-protein signaling loco [Chrysoperla carnea]